MYLVKKEPGMTMVYTIVQKRQAYGRRQNNLARAGTEQHLAAKYWGYVGFPSTELYRFSFFFGPSCVPALDVFEPFFQRCAFQLRFFFLIITSLSDCSAFSGTRHQKERQRVAMQLTCVSSQLSSTKKPGAAVNRAQLDKICLFLHSNLTINLLRLSAIHET